MVRVIRLTWKAVQILITVPETSIFCSAHGDPLRIPLGNVAFYLDPKGFSFSPLPSSCGKSSPSYSQLLSHSPL